MTINNGLQFTIHDLNITLWELVHEIARQDILEERKRLLLGFERTSRRRNLMLCGVFNGWEEWNWARAIELGWLSQNDLEVFKEEIEKETSKGEAGLDN